MSIELKGNLKKKVIKFYDNDLIQDQYCPDDDYKLEQHDVSYALTGRNSYNRDAGYIFIVPNLGEKPWT